MCIRDREKLHAMGNTPLKKVVTHRFEPTSKYVLLFIGGLALSLVILSLIHISTKIVPPVRYYIIKV